MAAFFTTYGFLIVSMLLGAMLGMSLYLPLMTGQLSLASPGFYALGGYIAAILSTTVFKPIGGLFPLPLLLVEMIIAGVVSGLLGILVDCFCGNFAGFIAKSGYHWRGCGHFWDSATVCDADRVFVDCTTFTVGKYGDCLSAGTDSGGARFCGDSG